MSRPLGENAPPMQRSRVICACTRANFFPIAVEAGLGRRNLANQPRALFWCRAEPVALLYTPPLCLLLLQQLK